MRRELLELYAKLIVSIFEKDIAGNVYESPVAKNLKLIFPLLKWPLEIVCSF